jgi:ring-1,2-phenylacetyl-CoA epoxidase subunit PaaD
MNHSTQNITHPFSDKEEEEIWHILSSVNDPEIPVLSVLDLGIVRDVQVKDEKVEVIITPTYSGCPAMDFIGMNIRKALAEKGFQNIKITHQLSPAWTTDWMTEEGKEKLKAFGIAPPVGKSFDKKYLVTLLVQCPHCHSMNTKVISEFGSTACKALYQCNDCGEPFDYFKCH